MFVYATEVDLCMADTQIYLNMSISLAQIFTNIFIQIFFLCIRYLLKKYIKFRGKNIYSGKITFNVRTMNFGEFKLFAWKKCKLKVKW